MLLLHFPPAALDNPPPIPTPTNAMTPIHNQPPAPLSPFSSRHRIVPYSIVAF
jgi:hypothetical protein